MVSFSGMPSERQIQTIIVVVRMIQLQYVHQVIVFLMTFLLFGCAFPDPQMKKVTIVREASNKGDAAFSPNPVIIPLGGRVVWKNRDAMEHSIVGDAKNGPCAFQSEPIVFGKKYKKSFFRRVTCDYYCGLHGRSMRGRIIVQ